MLLFDCEYLASEAYVVKILHYYTTHTSSVLSAALRVWNTGAQKEDLIIAFLKFKFDIHYTSTCLNNEKYCRCFKKTVFENINRWEYCKKRFNISQIFRLSFKWITSVYLVKSILNFSYILKVLLVSHHSHLKNSKC